jgi:simple sugar transport system substrate-binding protein
MKRIVGTFAALLLIAVALVAAGCGGDDNKSSNTGATGSQAAGGQGDNVDLTQSKNLTIAVITHGEGDTFWAVAKKGAEDAGKDMGVKVNYSESANDPQKQAQLIEAAVTQKVDGIATSLPDPDAMAGALKRATDAGIPVVTLNSGEADSAKLGAITHVGQTEEIAGEGAGRKLKEAGVKKMICVIHEQSNIGLNQRCDGAKKGFGGDVENVQVKGVNDIQTSLTEMQSKLQSDKSIDGVLTLNPDIAIAARDAIKGASSSAKLATFDLSGDVVKDIQSGDILFAVDQQQYLQGYLPVVFLTLYKTNLNTVGGGKPVLTGPGFVTKDNAAQVEKLSSEGSR